MMLPLTAAGQLVVTEINSNGTPADFWELTNFGSSEVDLGGYVWTDSTPISPIKVTIPSGTVIAPQESIVFAVTADPAGFRAAWGLASSVKVIAAVDPGLGQNDAIRLFASAAASTPLLTLNYAISGFTCSNGALAVGGHAGPSARGTLNTQSLILDPNFGPSAPRYTFATGGNFGSWQAPGGTATGSPGVVGTPASNSAPYFSGPAQTFWRTSKDLTYSPFRVQALDADVGQTVTYTVVSKPDWLSVVSDGLGKLKLGGTPNGAQFGDFPFTVRATDNAPGGSLWTDKTFTLTVYPPAGPVMLNEYNAVGSTDLLDPLSSGSDSYFGAIPGNGGDWFELVVTGTGVASSTVDLRGWTIEILGSGPPETLVLSDDPYWSNVMAGTILTFTEDDSLNGGLDTVIHKESLRSSKGYVWSNIWIHDPVFINQTASVIGNGISIDNNNTWFTIRNPTGTVVLGPCGEGIASDHDALGYPTTLVSVSSTEVLALRTNPAPTVDPLFGDYTDQSSSSFGSPNIWSSGTKSQSFMAYYATATPPRITSTPVRYATGTYSYTVTTADPNGGTPVLTAPGLPSFLTLTGSTVSNNRPLTLADAGEYTIRIEASDGTYITPQVFLLTVFNPSPTVVLNEYNAVDSTSPVGTFLNGGDLVADVDGVPNAVDKHFGRVEGNGGDWFELAVTGSGTAGTVDMRGWKIEIGQHNGPVFGASSMIELSNHSYWAAVPTGTILTFIERNTAQGGLDTGIALRNRRATLGDTWTNIWIGDSTYLTYTDALTNGYTVTGGVVSGVAVDDLGTRLRVKDAVGRVVFGAAGEGISPVSGVNQHEVFELQANPVPTLTPLSAAYLDDATGSSFGWPNEWTAGSQSFTAYVYTPTPYESWIAGFGVADPAPSADPDGDGRDNREEYAFGGNPGVADGPASGQTVANAAGTVTWQYARRSDDPSLVYSHQRSVDLASWQTLVPTSTGTAAHPTLAGFVMVTVTAPAAPVSGREFFRAVLAP